MEYQRLIAKHECLKTYFTEFPKQLHQLASEGRDFIKFTKKGLWINCMGLHEYLQSEESVFLVRHIMDFIDTLHVLQFYRAKHTRGEICFWFAHPNFTEDQQVPDDFYKQPSTDTKMPNGARRMNVKHIICLFDRLISMAQLNEMKISKLQYTRLQLQFALQKQVDIKHTELDSIYHDIAEPDYVKNQEIAGYYGNVELSLLKNGFGNYFPKYFVEEPSEPDLVPIPMDIDDSIVPNIPAETEEDDPIIDVGVETIPAIFAPKKQPVIANSILQEEHHQSKYFNSHIYEEEMENQPPLKRQCRSYKKQITLKETNNALIHLQTELGHFGGHR